MRIKSPFVYDTMLYPFERLFIRRWRHQGFVEINVQPLLLDVVKLITAEKPRE